MKIKETPDGERLLVHCSWQKHPDCPDKKTTKEQLEKAALAFNITKISSGCCEACARIVDQELDKSEKLALMDKLKQNHG